MRSTYPRLVLGFALLAGGCASERPALSPYSARPVIELARWQVFDGAVLVGTLVHLQIQEPGGPIPYYRIEDASGHWIGHATEQGRFSRRVPFQDAEQDLGLWSMSQGVAKLVEAKAPVELRRVVADADARRSEGSPQAK